jgi:mRNA-degrading endonuclease YafQ of YafQ-DinJ toxin-antitoxin module
LATHKLEGKLAHLLACSCGYDCRIVFEIEQKTGEKLVALSKRNEE